MKARDCRPCKRDSPYGGEGLCIYCQKTFASSGNLHRHIERMHFGTVRHEVCIEETPFDFEDII